jgi:hypothetical protein
LYVDGAQRWVEELSRVAIELAPSCSLAVKSGDEAGPPVDGGRDMSHGE